MWIKLFKSFNKCFVKFNNRRCLRKHNEYSLCTKCQDICPQPALKIVDNEVIFDKNKCNNCSLCAHACPTDAIRVVNEQMELYEQIVEESESPVSITCTELRGSEADIVLPCVLTMPPELLMISSLYSKKTLIVWNDKICLSCHKNWTQKRCLKWIEEWNNQQMSEETIEIIKTRNRIKPRITRPNQLFLKIIELKFLSSASEYEDEDICQKHNKIPMTDRRKYLLAYVKKANKNIVVPNEISKKLGIVMLNVSDNCQLCFKCTKSCPTGALLKTVENGVAALLFDPRLCINCDICEHSCIEINKKAIKIDEMTKEVVLKERTKK